MELLYKNFLNTTTQLTVNDNTATGQNVLFRDTRFEFSSDSFADDATTVTMRISFAETLTVDRIAMVSHNLKNFRIYYNGATANTFSLDPTANTSTSVYSNNSASSQYFRTTPVACTSVSIDMYSTIVPNQNKKLGYLVISEMRTDLNGRSPIAQSYRPLITAQNVVHKMSDGGTRIQTLEDKFSVSFALDFVNQETRDELKAIYDDHDDLIFCAFGTTTGWDEFIFPCVWSGDFDFFTFSDNAADAGYSGNIRLLETAV